MVKKRDFLKIDLERRSIELGVTVFTFTDGEFMIAYIPSLNLSGYGRTKADAYEMLLGDVLDDFYASLFELATDDKVIVELARYGWQQNQASTKEFRGPAVSMAELQKEVDQPDSRKISREYLMRTERIAA